jgi:hypothetical protein
MLRKFFTLLSVIALGFVYSAQAKIWRLNNNVAVNADFTSFYLAATSASVLPGDTLYLEPSATAYTTNSITLTKRLVVIGSGYFLDPSDATYPYNPGLQMAGRTAQLPHFRLGAGSDGSKFIGISMEQTYFNGASNVKFEKIIFVNSGIYFESGTNDNVSVRKCYFHQVNAFSMAAAAITTNFVAENNVMWGSYCSLDYLSGSGNIFRNNSISSSGNTFSFNNVYVANNIFGTGAASNFVNCTIKNNLFQMNQSLPATATNNQVNINMANVYVGGVATTSFDSRFVLKAGSPAIGAGLTIGSVVSPDCGAYGATDPYKLSGIPNIPSIYAFTVPLSIPAGTTTMNVTFSTRNNQ